MTPDVNRLQRARRFADAMEAAGADASDVEYIDWVHVANLLDEDPPSPDCIDLISTLMSWQDLGSVPDTPSDPRSSRGRPQSLSRSRA